MRLLNAQKTKHRKKGRRYQRNPAKYRFRGKPTVSCSKTIKHSEIPMVQTSDTEDIFEEFEKRVDDLSEDEEQNDYEWLDLTSVFEDKEKKGEDLSDEFA